MSAVSNQIICRCRRKKAYMYCLSMHFPVYMIMCEHTHDSRSECIWFDVLLIPSSMKMKFRENCARNIFTQLLAAKSLLKLTLLNDCQVMIIGIHGEIVLWNYFHDTLMREQPALRVNVDFYILLKRLLSLFDLFIMNYYMIWINGSPFRTLIEEGPGTISNK